MKIGVFLILILLLPMAYAAISWSENPAKTELTVVSNVPYCYEQGGMFYWYERGGITPAFSDCYRSDGIPKKCCPNGYSCVSEDGKYKCKDSGISSCGEYSEENCGNYDYGVAVADVESKTREGYCSSATLVDEECNMLVRNCRCVWDAGSDECISSYNVTKACFDGQETPIGECMLSVTSSTDCTNGLKTVKWTADWTGNPADKTAECVSEERQVACLSTSLSAVSTGSMIIAIVLILLFYFIFLKKKNREKTKKAKSRR